MTCDLILFSLLFSLYFLPFIQSLLVMGKKMVAMVYTASFEKQETM